MSRFTLTINFVLDARLRQIAKHFRLYQTEVLLRAVALMVVAADEIALGHRIVVLNKDDQVIKEFILGDTNEPEPAKKWFGFLKR
jgi:uncharacterized protein with PIN domain